MSVRHMSSKKNSTMRDTTADDPRKSIYATKEDSQEEIGKPNNGKIAKTDEERKKIDLVLRSIYIFSHLDEAKMNEIVNFIYERQVHNGEVIMNEEDPADNFYIVKSGVFEAARTKMNAEKELLETYQNRGYFGELALLYNKPRCATIKAISKAQLWVLDGRHFRKMVQRHAYRQRARYETLLKDTPLFSDLKEYEKSKLSDALITVEFKNGVEILEVGKTSENLHIIDSGEVRLVAKENKAVLKRSQCFGAEGILTDKPTPYQAICQEDCVLVTLSKVAANAFLQPHLVQLKKNYEANMKKLLG